MDAYEREIEAIENDDTLTQSEKNSYIRDVERDYRQCAREAANRAYDEEMERW